MKLKPSTEPKIVLKRSKEPELNVTEAMTALGAEPTMRPQFTAMRQDPAEKKPEHTIEVPQEEWDQLVSLAQELTSEEQAPTPSQVGRALLRKAIIDLMQGKQQLKASLQEKPAQAAE